MLLEAIGFAFLAALNPSALLIGAAYLGSANPRKTAGLYLAGAIIMTAALGVLFLVAIRAGGASAGSATGRPGIVCASAWAWRRSSRESWWRGESRGPRGPIAPPRRSRAGWPA